MDEVGKDRLLCSRESNYGSHQKVVKSNSSKQEAYNCHICNLEIDSMNSLKEHLQMHHRPKMYQCGICQEILSTQSHLIRHMKFHCSTSDLLNEQLKKRSSRKTFKCPLCSRELLSKRKLINHMEIHSKALKFKCDICGKEYNKEGNKKNHMRCCKEKKILKKVFKCLICSIECATESGLKIHMNSHPKCKEFKCDHCSYSFAQKIQLEIHILLAHTGKNTCGFCGEEFSQNIQLEKHITKAHTATYTFKCGVCGKEFVRSWLLRKHMAVHSEPEENAKPKFKCQQCSQNFTKEFHLKQHMLIHNNEVFIDNNSLVIKVDIDATTMSSDPKEDPLAINDEIPSFVKEENTDSELSEETPSSIIKSECFIGSEFPVKLRSISVNENFEMNNCIFGDVKIEMIKEEHQCTN